MHKTSLNSIKGVFNDLTDLFYPRLCPGCENVLRRNEKILCLNCMFNMPKTDHFEERENPLEKVFWGRLPLNWAAALYNFRKKGIVQNLVHNIKYRGQKEAAEFAGKQFAQELTNSELDKPGIIIPVPLHKRKLKQRGFNQSYHFGLGISKELQIPINDDILVRKIHTGTQTRKNRFERWKNVGHIFALQKSRLIENRHVLLIDDIVTSGATIEASGLKILEADGVSLSVGVIGQAT